MEWAALWAAASLLFVCGFGLGAWMANRSWVAKASLRWGRKEHDGRLYWVVDDGDPVACHHLCELLDARRERREEREAVERLRGTR